MFFLFLTCAEILSHQDHLLLRIGLYLTSLYFPLSSLMLRSLMLSHHLLMLLLHHRNHSPPSHLLCHHLNSLIYLPLNPHEPLLPDYKITSKISIPNMQTQPLLTSLKPKRKPLPKLLKTLNGGLQ
ncbi:hypothetical protein Lalb_Chr01g0016691 [Lupinus albus]|uniref:Uncharacterized protein n=1 Tax=Lupinus albus TaxID=3870 RepID=A0A6A4R405_LUPAL|nr:hypothetical protein Lalb_Chr01g0016691 [Lupinus albus]